MYKAVKVIAVIPARGGSKSIPHKNIVPLAGKPLLAWSIEAARKTPEIDRIIVSTDDQMIAKIAGEYNAEVYNRPAHLATDEALVIDALKDLIAKLRTEGDNADVMVLLEPTCPFRAVEDIQQCIHLLIEKNLDSIATFKEAELNPHRAWRIDAGRPEPFIEGSNPWLPRQQLPKAYQLNGAVYAFRITDLPEDGKGLLFGRSGAVVVPPERSIDIDSIKDIYVAEAMVKRQEGKQ